MKRLMLVIGATAALAIGSVAPVAAGNVFLAGTCANNGTLADTTTFTVGGGGGEIIRLKIVNADRNGDGYACTPQKIRKGGPVHLTDNNVPMRKKTDQ